ncbi:MAG: ParB/RepB/Spo0J family partition protein [Ruminococcaceae bacterium]|nr:ParB/RepB/Spo0J family partition protein [Oscillospiraceae bacterium]
MNKAKAEYLNISQLQPFEGHPFQVKEDEEMEQLIWSILTQGLLTPLVVRPIENNQYEVISGHRRLHACKKAGIESVPALVYSMNRDEATIALVDSNLHREKLLPSEKAWAYKLKMEALSHQGKTCGQVGHKSRDILSDEESGRQIQRYIRLTNLIPEILQKVDEGRIAFTPAVELSYLTEEEQYELLEQMEIQDCTPSLSQACRLKKLSREEGLSSEMISLIMGEEKANQREMFKVPMERLRKFVPKADAKQTEDFVMKACEYYHRFLQRQKAQCR